MLKSTLRFLFFLGILVSFALILYVFYPAFSANLGAAYDLAVRDSDGVKSANILIRLYENFPRGWHYFIHAPITGVGFGSINDLYVNGGSLIVETGRLYEYNSAHAHNSYLTILGELGLVGLVLFMLVLAELLKYIKRYAIDERAKFMLLLGFWALTFASLAEHRWPSPSNIFPFIYLLGLGVRRA